MAASGEPLASWAAAGPPPKPRAGPCQPTGSTAGPGTAWRCMPGQPEPGGLRAGPCSCRAKRPGFGPGCRASGCMARYICRWWRRHWRFGGERCHHARAVYGPTRAGAVSHGPRARARMDAADSELGSTARGQDATSEHQTQPRAYSGLVLLLL